MPILDKSKIERWYRQGLWTATQVLQAVEKGIITDKEADEILSKVK